MDLCNKWAANDVGLKYGCDLTIGHDTHEHSRHFDRRYQVWWEKIDGVLTVTRTDQAVNETERRASEQYEKVEHPKHYNSHPSGIEAITIIQHFTFNVGNAVKYLWRAGLKPGASVVEDLKKARFYIEAEIKRLEG